MLPICHRLRCKAACVQAWQVVRDASVEAVGIEGGDDEMRPVAIPVQRSVPLAIRAAVALTS